MLHMYQCACGSEFPTQFNLNLHMDKCNAWRENGVVDPIGTQSCKSCFCRKQLSVEYFNYHPNRKCGFDAKCKECSARKSKLYAGAHSEEIRVAKRSHYESNREKILESKRDFYYKNQTRLLQEKKDYVIKTRATKRAYNCDYRTIHQDELREKSALTRNFIINSVLDHLGPICEFCGIIDREFLTVDHINDDGRDERHMGSVGWKRQILVGKLDSSRYRVLCHNCNNSRYRENPVHHFSKKPLQNVMRKCYVCLQEKDTSKFPSLASHGGNRCLSCRRKNTQERRMKLMMVLGHCCTCCGITEMHKLTVDHIMNDGSVGRINGERTGIDILSAIVRGDLPKENYQLLCWNCNYSKFRGSGICFHVRTQRTP